MSAALQTMAAADRLPAIADRERLAALRATELLDTPPEEPFDRITRLAQRLLDVPVALISLVGEDRQFFKSARGLTGETAERRESPLSHSFCQFVVATGEVLVVDDSRRSLLVRNNPAVEQYGVVAYAGAPLEGPSGAVLGTLCVVDHRPRSWTAEEIGLLDELTALANSEIAYRVKNRRLAAVEAKAAALGEPVEALGDAVRSLASVASTCDDPRVERFAALARSRAATIEALTGDLAHALAEGRRTVTAKLVAVDLGERVLRASRVASLASGSDDLTVEIRQQPIAVTCDSYELERSLTHLLISALHHADPASGVHVVVRIGDGCAVVQVSSKGGPMPAAELSRIVSRFHIVTCPVPGAPPAATIRALGRSIVVENGPVRGVTSPSGTTVRVELALTPPRSALTV